MLLRAWEDRPGVKLKIIGDGPLADQVRAAAAKMPDQIEYLGRKPVEEVIATMGEAACLVFPSVWYEGLPKTIVESLARGTPVVASKIGAMIDLIDHGRTGLHFPTGDAGALAQSVRSLFAYPQTLADMRKNCRAEFLAKYTADQNYRKLIAIYESVLHRTPAAAAVSPT